MNTSIPTGLPQETVNKLVELNKDFDNGYLTEKGYIKKRVSILAGVPAITASPNSSDGLFSHQRAYSIASTLTRKSTIDSTKRNTDGGHNPTPPAFNVELQKPLDPRVINDLNSNGTIETLSGILRNRGTTYQRETALIILDSKGKESVSISWEKLYLKSEKVAQQIRDRSGLYKNDRVCLIYQNSEVVEFIVALFGCFLAGVVAVPITLDFKLQEMIHIMTVTQSHLCLSSDAVLKYLDKKLTAQTKLKWPKGLEFWKTTEFGSYHPNKKEVPVLQVPDLAYIEFVRAPDGELNGVAISHKTILSQMNQLTSILSSNPNYDGKIFKRKDISYTRNRNVMFSILDARKSVGLIVGTLLNVFTGNLLVWSPSSLLDIAGLYANLITKYEVTILLNDYLNLKQVVYNYQSFPQYTRKFSKKEVDFSKIKWVLIYTSIVDGEFHEILTNRWLKPLGCKNVDNIVAPLLTLSEFGGMVISMRDWIGEEHKLNTQMITPSFEDDEFSKNISSLSEVLIDKKSLTTNTVKVISDRPPPITETIRSSEFLRIGSFGYPLPDATLAIVNPETCYLAGVMEVGEIWIDSVSLPGGFWSAPEGTQNIFQARCQDHEGVLDLEFLRTGLLGFTYCGKVYVLGLYEDRLRQRVTFLDKPENIKELNDNPLQLDYRYHYSDHLAYTLARAIPQKRVSDSSAFDVLFNNEYLPVVVIESPAAVPNVQGAVDIPELDLVATKSFIVLERYHNVRPYCILILPPDTLPRTIKSGIPGIANMMCKRYFLEGNLKSVYVKYNIKRSITEIPRSKYYLDSIWSESVSNFRYRSLLDAEDQFSGLDYRDTAIDDRTRKPLTDFDNILEIFKWRVKYQPDELAFSLISRGASKPYSWKKFDNKIAGVVSLILDKMKTGKLAPGNRVGLMFTLCEDFVSAIYACWFTGLIPIPLNPIDVNRVKSELSSLSRVIKDYDIINIFVNQDSEHILKNKPVSPAMKQDFALSSIKIRNTSKATSKTSLSSYLPTIERVVKKKIRNDDAILILLNFSEDDTRTGVTISFNNISSLCKILKETCQLESKNPIISCIRHTAGLGFIQTVLIGIYVGCPTYLFPPLEFATNPGSFFVSLSKYKVKDLYVTEQMLAYGMKVVKNYDFSLEKIKNLMVGYEGRPNTGLIKAVATRFSSTKLNSSSISHVYTHNFNPMITLRSYLSFDPIDLWIDPSALRLGLISIVNPSNITNAIHVQDSGIVPVCTQIAIVNPETRRLCKVGEVGEIWVCSEANVLEVVHKFGKPSTSYDKLQFNAKIMNGDDSLSYMRTGDLGFLHNVSRFDKNSGTLEFQPLFLLGPISYTFESMGLMHFVTDIEASIESSHGDIRNGGSCVFKADGFIIAVIDSFRLKYLSSLVPVIFNKVLNDHNLILDIVAFTKPNGFPYSKLGIKQRGNIVERFTTKKLNIQAQYGLNYGEESLIKTVQELENINDETTVDNNK